MRLCIGTTLGGRPVLFDTTASRPLLVVGDLGRGKTTLARFLTRWWLAEVTQRARVFADLPHQWADIVARFHPLDSTRAELTSDRAWLTIVDGADTAPSDVLRAAMARPTPTIITSYGPAALQLAGPGGDCVGLVPAVREAASRGPVLDIRQGRLDWPDQVTAIVPVRCGIVDFPCHRWHTQLLMPVGVGL